MRALLLGVLTLFTVQTAIAQDGVSRIESPFDVQTTLDKLTTALESQGITVFGRIDHAANATNVELSLRPTQVLLFGNPRLGTPLMNCAQSVALDLPQKMLAWEDESGQIYLGWNDPAYLKTRHHIEGCDDVLQKVNGALAKFAKAATTE